jgi:serine/threonine-protein kinase
VSETPVESGLSNALVGGKYRVTRLLGKGGMGTVYEARHELIGRRFALKFLHAELAVRADVMARFRREAQAAGALENENIAAVTDFGTAGDGAPYIVMEYLPGEDLARLLARVGQLSAPRAVYAAIQACRGLAAAHASNIVHRDLKPENLFVVKRGDGTDLIKILDFGIAKLHQEGDASSSTDTGVTLGTPFYMPPEQARGQKDLDQRADIYAIGVILYEILSGQKPHRGDGYNAILYQILTQKPVRLETLRANLPDGLVEVVHKAMASEAADRYQTANELIDALAPFAGRALTPVDSVELEVPQSSATSATVLTPPETKASVPSAPPRAQRSDGVRGISSGRAFMVGLALCVVLAIGVIVLFGRGHGSSFQATTQRVPLPEVSTLAPSLTISEQTSERPVDAPSASAPPVPPAPSAKQVALTASSASPPKKTVHTSRLGAIRSVSKSPGDLYAP